MNALIIAIWVVLCVATVISYPYDDAYKPGDIVPYGNQGNQQEYPGSNGRNVPNGRGGSYGFKRGFYGGVQGQRGRQGQGTNNGGGMMNSRQYRMRRRNNGYLRPRGLGGYKKNYDSYDYYDYSQYKKPYNRERRPSFYSNDYNYDY